MAVNVADWSVETAATVAVKVAVVAPAATLTEAGTVTAALLLDKVTVVPLLGAAVLRVTVQESVPGPTTELLAQVSALGAGVTTATPVPLKLTVAVLSVVELVVTVNCPVAAPAAVGLNCTVTL